MDKEATAAGAQNGGIDRSCHVCRAYLEQGNGAERVWMGNNSCKQHPRHGCVRTRRTLGDTEYGHSLFLQMAVWARTITAASTRAGKKKSPWVHEAVERGGGPFFIQPKATGYHINEKLVGEALKGYTDRVIEVRT